MPYLPLCYRSNGLSAQLLGRRRDGRCRAPRNVEAQAGQLFFFLKDNTALLVSLRQTKRLALQAFQLPEITAQIIQVCPTFASLFSNTMCSIRSKPRLSLSRDSFPEDVFHVMSLRVSLWYSGRSPGLAAPPHVTVNKIVQGGYTPQWYRKSAGAKGMV